MTKWLKWSFKNASFLLIRVVCSHGQIYVKRYLRQSRNIENNERKKTVCGRKKKWQPVQNKKSCPKISGNHSTTKIVLKLKLTSALCNLSFNGISNYWFFHFSIDSQSILHSLLLEEIISFDFTSYLFSSSK